MWRLLSQGISELEIVTLICSKYGVTKECVGADLCALLKRIAELQLMPTSTVAAEPQGRQQKSGDQVTYPWYGQPEANKPQPNCMTILVAIIGLAVFDFILWTRSLNSLCSYVRVWPVWKRDRTDSEMTGRVCSAVERACVWYPKQALCLQRSAVTACLLRSFGIRAEMKIGMRPMPFLAHAWVEVDGSVVNDWAGVRTFYSSLASY